MAGYLLGIDIGTTNVKAVLFNIDGVAVAQAGAEYPTYFPTAGWAEQDPELWWQAATEVIRGVIAKAQINSGEIAALSISSQAPTMLPVNDLGEPLRPALIWMDRRSEEQCNYLRQEIGEERILRITGNRIDPYFMLPKLLWFKKYEPQLFQQTTRVLQANGYLNYKLTGRFSLDKAHASLTQIYDVNTGQLAFNLCQKLGLAPELFPELYDCAAVIGGVSREAAARTGLAPGTPIVAGTVDGAAAALEAGVIGPGEAVEMSGTSTVVLLGSDCLKNNGQLISMYHALKGRYLVIGAASSTGASLKWFRDQFGYMERLAAEELKLNAYDLMNLEASEVPADAGGIIFLPYMMGERSPIWDTYARGVFAGLTLKTTRGQLIRAIMEGAAFALYHNLQEAAAIGLKIKELRCVGGGALSNLWLKIKASVINLPVVVPETSLGAPFGDALLAGAGIGIYKDIESLTGEFVHFKQRIEPDSHWHAIYQELYGVYRDLYNHIRDDLFKLAHIKAGGTGSLSSL